MTQQAGAHAWIQNYQFPATMGFGFPASGATVVRAYNPVNINNPVATGSIAGTVMTIATAPVGGTFASGQTVDGLTVLPNTTITSLGTGVGGVGTYNITPSQTFAGPVIGAHVGTFRNASLSADSGQAFFAGSVFLAGPTSKSADVTDLGVAGNGNGNRICITLRGGNCPGNGGVGSGCTQP
jgi:hypothetical protein